MNPDQNIMLEWLKSAIVLYIQENAFSTSEEIIESFTSGLRVDLVMSCLEDLQDEKKIKVVNMPEVGWDDYSKMFRKKRLPYPKGNHFFIACP